MGARGGESKRSNVQLRGVNGIARRGFRFISSVLAVEKLKWLIGSTPKNRMWLGENVEAVALCYRSPAVAAPETGLMTGTGIDRLFRI